MKMNQKCILCDTFSPHYFSDAKERTYYSCPQCGLVFLGHTHYLSESEEIERYKLHTHDSFDQGHINFLKPALLCAYEALVDKKTCSLLDFGCGPFSQLKVMNTKRHIRIDEFDLNFKNDQKVFSNKYDLIVLTEVIEHLKNPLQVFNQLKVMLNPSSAILVQTSLWHEDIDFKNWHYIRDPTHIAFYSHKSFEYLCKTLQLQNKKSRFKNITLITN